MIEADGIFWENDYFKDAYDVENRPPKGMGNTAAVVLAVDVAPRPLNLRMNSAELSNGTAADARAFRKRFKDIDQEHPAPLPLQVYDGAVAVRRTVDNLLASGVAHVLVAAVESVLDGVREALAGTSAQVMRYDAAAVEAIDAESDGIRIELLTRGQALWAQQQLPASPKVDAVLFMHADQAAFEPRHLRRLRTLWEEDPTLDFVSAYAEWRTGLPLLLPAAFLEKLAKRPAGKLPRCQGARQQACRTYHARHAMMGEDKLFGPTPSVVEATKAGALPASALLTVQAARHIATPYEKRAALAAGAKEDPHVAAARTFLQKLDESLEKHPIPGLEEADAWARRNRGDFPLLSTRDNAGFVYLDAGATSLQTSNVIAATTEFAAHYSANIWRGVYGNAAHATNRYQEAREKVARFINADPRDVIFTTNTTTSMNLVSQAWAQHNLKKGSLILVLCTEHHSNLLPWRQAAEAVGGRLKFIPIDKNGRVSWDAYLQLLDEKPALVCAAQVSNVIGLENPIRRMAKEAHRAGAVFVMDAAQSAPHMPLDVQRLGADFVAFSGHKMHAPTGIGVLWAHPSRVREMVPTQVGGGTISEVSFDGTYWRQAPYSFEPGTPPIQQAIGLGAAVDYLQTLGMDKVEWHARVMSQYALRVASLLPYLQVHGNHSGKDGGLGVLSFAFKTLDSTQVSTLLGRMGVAVRSGAHCAVQLALALGVPGTTRITFGPYTTKADIEAFGYAVSVVQKVAANQVPRS